MSEYVPMYGCVDIDVKEIYFQDLVHLIVEAGISEEICKAGSRLEAGQESRLLSGGQNIFSHRETSVCRKGFSTDKML